MKIKYITNEGISIVNDEVTMNINADSSNDILNLLEVDIYKTEFLGNIYYFGYRFKDSASRKDRTTILKWLKGLSTNSIDNKSLQQFIQKPLVALNKQINLMNIDAILYPKSNRSNLNKIIAKELNKFISHTAERQSFELIKTLSNSVQNEDVKNAISKGNILIVDDINTSGSTLTEILRIVKAINNNCNIYIFTLVGKE